MGMENVIGSIDCRLILASKLRPPVVKPPALRISRKASVISGTFIANWSVSPPDW